MLKQLYETFQPWSADGSVYIYSDPHFGDSDCLLMDRHWPSPDGQVEKINSKVRSNDTLIILGDIGNIDYVPLLKAKKKIMIAGNHDSGLSNYKRKKKVEIFDIDKLKTYLYLSDNKDILNYLREDLNKIYPNYKINIYENFDFHMSFHTYRAVIDNNLFDEVYGGPLFISDKILLSHEPIDLPFALNIHGHVHDGIGHHYENNKYNVCSNCINYEPVNLKDIIKTGCLKDINSIHRLAIDKATERKASFIEKE